MEKRTKNIVVGSLCALTLIALPVQAMAGYAGPSNQGGFSGPGPAHMTAQEAIKQKDDTWVTLKGKIINRQGDDMYTFQDASGQGLVEIDDKAWGGQNITAQDTVELLVKVDKDWGDIELEVKRVRLVK